MSVTDELLENAKGYADGFDKGDLPLPPARGVVDSVTTRSGARRRCGWAGAGLTAVTFLCDTGERYFTTPPSTDG